jgi:hypothetical protein
VYLINWHRNFTFIVIFMISACVDTYTEYIGNDVKQVVQSLETEGYMMVWPGGEMKFPYDETKIFKNCKDVKWVVLVPRKNPNHGLHIYSDDNCKVSSIEKKKREGP